MSTEESEILRCSVGPEDGRQVEVGEGSVCAVCPAQRRSMWERWRGEAGGGGGGEWLCRVSCSKQECVGAMERGGGVVM